MFDYTEVESIIKSYHNWGDPVYFKLQKYVCKQWKWVSLSVAKKTENTELLSGFIYWFSFSVPFHTLLYKFFNHQCAVFMSLASNVTKAVCRLWWINLSPTSHPQGFHLLISDHCLSDWPPHCSFTLRGFRLPHSPAALTQIKSLHTYHTQWPQPLVEASVHTKKLDPPPSLHSFCLQHMWYEDIHVSMAR